MTLHIGKLLSHSCGKCSKGYTLIQLHIISDLCCLTYNHSGSMVNKEILPDSRTWVDINSCTAVCIF